MTPACTSAAGAAAPPRSWGTEQLTAFLAAVTASASEETAIRSALERIAETFEAEIVAVGGARGLEQTYGMPRGEALDERLIQATDTSGGGKVVELDGIGAYGTLAVPLEHERLRVLVLARRDPPTLDAEEQGLLRAMGRVLTMCLSTTRALRAERNLRSIAERKETENRELLMVLREREQLLARLSRIQRSIASRTALEEVLESVVDGAAELLQDEVVGLRLVSSEDPSRWEMAASRGIPMEALNATREGAVGVGIGGRAISEGELIVVEDYENAAESLPFFVADGIRAAMAAPVREQGEVVGSLVVATHTPKRSYSHAEREILLTFAEHVSLALNDAKAVSDAIHQAMHDSLTALPNRSLLLDRLGQALARSRRSGATVTLMFCDLDDFKTINDSLGHAAGDDLLVLVAQRLAECIRPGDTAARLGGDEFVLLFEGLDSDEVAAPALRIHEALEIPFRVRERDVVVSASIGIAAGGTCAEDMLRNADLALYRAKGAGKGRFEIFEPPMHAAMVEKLELEGALRQALDSGELCLHYQPIVRLADRSVVAVEALVRWNHPERGLLPPAQFVPVAEDSRLIVPLGRWVLAEACRQSAEWHRQLGASSPATSVNLSGLELAEADLADYVATLLEEHGIEPSNLTLELTETALVQDIELAVSRLHELKALGVRLAIDDFGTGYASLQHLRSFPVDAIKIAKPFVDGVAGTSYDSALARAVIDLGDSFELRVVAEGIELEVQAARLVELGCELGQGYLFGRPAPASEIAAQLVPAVAPAG